MWVPKGNALVCYCINKKILLSPFIGLYKENNLPGAFTCLPNRV